MKPIVLVAAMDASRAIGSGNDIPWRIAGEQKRFKDLTMGNALIMGRMTYESIGRPLPGRHCIILSRSIRRHPPGIHPVSTMSDALRVAEDLPGLEIAIGGGQQVYELFLPLADRIHLTRIQADFGGDRHFPPIVENEFTLSCSEEIDGLIPYTYLTYERRVSSELSRQGF